MLTGAGTFARSLCLKFANQRISYNTIGDGNGINLDPQSILDIEPSTIAVLFSDVDQSSKAKEHLVAAVEIAGCVLGSLQEKWGSYVTGGNFGNANPDQWFDTISLTDDENVRTASVVELANDIAIAATWLEIAAHVSGRTLSLHAENSSAPTCPSKLVDALVKNYNDLVEGPVKTILKGLRETRMTDDLTFGQTLLATLTVPSIDESSENPRDFSQNKGSGPLLSPQARQALEILKKEFAENETIRHLLAALESIVKKTPIT